MAISQPLEASVQAERPPQSAAHALVLPDSQAIFSSIEKWLKQLSPEKEARK